VLRKKDSVEYLSRSGKVLRNYDHFTTQVMQDTLPGMVFDCEGINKSGFQSLMRGKPDKLAVFDGLPLNDWNKQVSYSRQTVRRFIFTPNQPVFTVPRSMVHSHQELEAVYRQWVAKGAEGVICKQPNAVYSFARTNNWMKIKPAHTVDVPIIGANYGVLGKKWEGKIGSLIVEFNGVKVNVSSGLSDEDHENLSVDYQGIVRNKNVIISETTVEITYDSVTEDGSLRFPRIKLV
jgi:ATP-dependent DNA ligase